MKIDYDYRLQFIGLNSIECQGCHKIKNQCSFLTQFNITYMNKCPCRQCIVKTTCDTYCDDRSNLYQEYIDRRDDLYVKM